MNKLELDDFTGYNAVSSLTASPNRIRFAFVRSEINVDENKYKHHLYINDMGIVKRVYSFENSMQFYWETDETLLINTSSSENQKKSETTFSRLFIANGEFEVAYTFPIPVGGLKVINADTLIISTNLSVADHVLFNKDERQAYLDQAAKETFFEVFDEVPFYFNGGGFTKGKRSQSFVYAISTETFEPLAAQNEDISLVHYNKDTNRAYFVFQAIVGTPQFFDDVKCYDFNTQTLTTLYENTSMSISKLFALEDTVYVFANDMVDYGINQNSDVYRLVDGSLEKVCDFGLSANNSVGSDVRYGGYPTADTFNGVHYFVGTYRNRSILYTFNGSDIKEVFSKAGSLDAWIYCNDAFYGIGLFDNALQEVYKLNIDSGDATPITAFNTKVLDGKYIAKPNHHEFIRDGIAMDGWVLLPEGYSEDNTYPAILDIHGGPKTIYNESFYHEMQVWANLGYIVFFANPRGSDVYGNDFMDIRGKYGTVDFEDLMAFTDIVLDHYAIDASRVGVTGGSYGGFMTNWIVSHTDRFRAAATQRSISNWISFYGTADIGLYFANDQTGATPYDGIERMWEQSPLKHANNIKTPLLFIHSDEDYRCPIEQAMQLYSIVRNNGVETRFLWVRGENHDLSRSGRPQARLKRLQEITNWFEAHLK
ncbi:S9 family peptidase [Erysipelothrix sp. HDW6C]|uniref:alpha/beta hydrolase family protein n=1 Tax=Erysipelothrix sp. HDW6C TaxID=2714930 RepID=UPI00140E3B9E|nr:S9 family peptidase [Erysipelothrix sp. HDW6C]QIK70496.1 S9 family peptidase [Erysipelothrix sp. HDW6C]